LWGPYRGSTNFSDLRRWAATALPVSPDFWAKLDPNAGWEVFYLALLLDAKAQEINPKLAEPSIRSALQLRLGDATLFADRTVVGQVDDVGTLLELRPVAASTPTPSAAPDPRRAIFLHCDEATLCTDGEITVSGWVVCATGVAAVAVTLDDEPVGETELGLHRADVAKAYPGIPQARFAGFRLNQRISGPLSGGYQIGIAARNGLDDIQAMSLSVTANEPKARLASEPDDFHFELDNPVVIDGVVPDPVIGRLVIEGWALARSGVEAIEIFLDDHSLGPAYYGTARRDVEAAFPDWEEPLRCGYIFHFHPRALQGGTHRVRLELKARNGSIVAKDFRIDVRPAPDAEDDATIRRRLTRAEVDLYEDIIHRLGCRPAFRLVIAAGPSVAADAFAVTLRSLANQAYANWHLLVVAEQPVAAHLCEIAAAADLGDRVSFVLPSAGQSALFGRPAGEGSLQLLGVVMPGDELGADALAEIAIARGLHPTGQFFYADEDRVSPVGNIREPFFKPDWSPDLLLSTNYIGRPWFAATDVVKQAGVTPATISAPQGDYDAVLRCTEVTARIQHVPNLLSRRADADLADPAYEQRVLRAAADRRGLEAELLPGCVPGTWRLKRTTHAGGEISIIIPTCAAQGHIAKCLDTLRTRTTYRYFEIICIDNIPPDQPEWKALIRCEADKVVDAPEAFNWSRFNNRAAEQAGGKYLVFLNDDIEVERGDWLNALLEHAQCEEVGIVGPQLLYPDRKVQHAGVFLTTLGAGRHAFRFLPGDDPGYFGLALTQRNVIAVTGACMMMRRDVFEQLGRFDEAHEVVNNDVDCCLRAWKAGYRVVYTPYAQLIHHELASRARLKDVFDTDQFARRWRSVYAAGDPFFSPRLTKFADEYRTDSEPARLICPARPLFRAEEIRHILAVKLDHIGDLITAIPALRRLRQHFPQARISLLASSAACSVLAGEDCVDEVIEFAYFHARSGLGAKDVTEEELRALGERLASYRFDLAVDFRKQLETRHVLSYIPSRFRAGFNHLGRFPWLDIAPEWEGDNYCRRKQSHISDDLLRLVEAVALAASTERAVLARASVGKPTLPAPLRALFRRPVVAVHPGVGAVLRQWMPEHFAAVIDLLIEQDQVNVVVLGAPEEAELAGQVLAAVVNREHVASLAGRTSLAELTTVLRRCVLYLGNNSGPKHIAAALGVPTVGIHSGVVDATEWGPVGPRAVAVQRNMRCSPCYLVKPEDCVRGVACLRRLDPAVVYRYCRMLMARTVPEGASRWGATGRASSAERLGGDARKTPCKLTARGLTKGVVRRRQ
jgi:ADP-heptose:LPS heptosyltransferase/GT2 family glycosyltransferase